jgi:hypothetical protein
MLMKTTHIILLLLVLSHSIASAGSMDSAYGVSVRAVDLARAYHENAVAAQGKYGGTRLSVGGIITKIGIDDDGDPYVILEGPVHCKFTEAFNAKVARLQPRTAIAISGIVVGKSSGVVLKDCTF